MKLLKKTITYKDKITGEEKKGTNFFLVLENGNYIQIKPSFKDGFAVLKFVAEEVIEGVKND